MSRRRKPPSFSPARFNKADVKAFRAQVADMDLPTTALALAALDGRDVTNRADWSHAARLIEWRDAGGLDTIDAHTIEVSREALCTFTPELAERAGLDCGCDGDSDV